MANWERNRGDQDDLDRGSTRSDRGGIRDDSARNREVYGRESNQSGYSSERDWNDHPDRGQWQGSGSEQFTGRNRFDQGRGSLQGGRGGFSDRDISGNDYSGPGRPGERSSFDDYDRGRNDYVNDMFASSSGTPYGGQQDQRPLGSYGDRDDFRGSQNRNRGGRFSSSSDLSSSYQGHYGQQRFGSVGDSAGFGTGSSIIGSSNMPSSGRTTSDRNLYGGASTGFESGITTQSYRGIGPKGFQRSDERIREMVSETLEDHEAIDATDIEVSVSSGEVTLTGTVPNRHMKRLAEDTIEFLPGVRDVTNSLKVNRSMFGRVADSIQHALSGDEGENVSRASSRTSGAGRGSSRSKR